MCACWEALHIKKLWSSSCKEEPAGDANNGTHPEALHPPSSSQVPSVQVMSGDRKGGSITPTPRLETEPQESSYVRVFTYNELKSATRNFRPNSALGEGGFGTVYKGWIDDIGPNGVKIASNITIAVKVLNQEGLQGHREWLAEVNVLGQLRHPHLVRLIGYCCENEHRLLVYEYMPLGSLENHLFRKAALPLSWATRMKIAYGAAKGLAFLHGAQKPVIYRDFKTSNILLDSDYTAKLSDFGLAKDGPQGDQTHVSTRVMGTYGYAAPEYVMTGHLTARSDVYSFGVVLLELITGQQPISHGKNLVREVNSAYEAGMVLSFVDPRMGHYPSECLQPFLRLAIACCMDETDARPTMADVVRELEAIWRLMPLQDSMLSFETSVETNAGNVKDGGSLPSSNPFVSSDIDGSNLISGYIPSIAPR